MGVTLGHFTNQKRAPSESATKQAEANLESSPDVFFFPFLSFTTKLFLNQ